MCVSWRHFHGDFCPSLLGQLSAFASRAVNWRWALSKLPMSGGKSASPRGSSTTAVSPVLDPPFLWEQTKMLSDKRRWKGRQRKEKRRNRDLVWAKREGCLGPHYWGRGENGEQSPLLWWKELLALGGKFVVTMSWKGWVSKDEREVMEISKELVCTLCLDLWWLPVCLCLWPAAFAQSLAVLQVLYDLVRSCSFWSLPVCMLLTWALSLVFSMWRIRVRINLC